MNIREASQFYKKVTVQHSAFNEEKALVGALSVIVQPVVEPMEHYTASVKINQ